MGVAVGAAYGVLLRGYILAQALLRKHLNPAQVPDAASMRHFVQVNRIMGESAEVMTLAFLVLGPLVIGYLTVSRLAVRSRANVAACIFVPWLSILCMMAIVALFAWEGAICVAMALPLTLLFSSIGGLVARISGRHHRLRTAQTTCVALLPFVLAPAEALMPAPTQTRTVHNQIVIHANAPTVWHNIERVPAIAPVELRPNWTHRLGFPRPVEATLSYEGVGGIRHATFERGVLFIETVTTWEPQHRLAFTIRADTANIPAGTLDQHVTIGGRYFDVLDGEYRLEPLPNGDTLLHLTSHQRLSTDFNGYAGLWTGAVMSSLQTSILQVIQHRCENISTAALPSR